MDTLTPADLHASGSALWESITSKYDLRPDELVILEAACHAADRIDALEEARAGVVLTTGSTGQVVVHPAISEIRATEAQVSKLLASLKLPDADGNPAESSRSTQARAAAQSRWARVHGKGA